jgi:hypothetical protein
MRARVRGGPNVWVVRFGPRFSVTEEGTRIHLVPPIPQRAAIVLARAIARANRSGLLVQSRKGRIRFRVDGWTGGRVDRSDCVRR